MHRPMMNALGHIRQLDYTVIYARDLPAMRHFYEKVMEFPVINVLSNSWIEFGLGANRLALTVYGGRFKDVPPPVGNLCLQLTLPCRRPKSRSAPRCWRAGASRWCCR